MLSILCMSFFFSSRRRHTRCALVTGVQTCALPIYHTSKGAVRLLTKAAAVECAQLGTGIRVNSVHPAIVATEMGTNFIQHFVDLGLAPDYPTAEGAIKAAHPIGDRKSTRLNSSH